MNSLSSHTAVPQSHNVLGAECGHLSPLLPFLQHRRAVPAEIRACPARAAAGRPAAGRGPHWPRLCGRVRFVRAGNGRVTLNLRCHLQYRALWNVIPSRHHRVCGRSSWAVLEASERNWALAKGRRLSAASDGIGVPDAGGDPAPLACSVPFPPTWPAWQWVLTTSDRWPVWACAQSAVWQAWSAKPCRPGPDSGRAGGAGWRRGGAAAARSLKAAGGWITHCVLCSLRPDRAVRTVRVTSLRAGP